jgi:antitoxin component YwqK of YwqJK toxin-antitoxin module
LVLVGCSKKEIPEEQLLYRAGIAYIASTNRPVEGWVVTTYDDGKIKKRSSYKDGNREGLEEEFYKNGRLWAV